MEGLSNLPEMLAAVLRSHLDDLAFVAAIRERIITMQEGLKRLSSEPRRSANSASP